MSKDKILYQGKAKTIIKGPKKHTLIQRFKDDATAYNKKKHKIFKGKGILNNKISEYLMNHLRSERIPMSFIKRINKRDQLMHECEIIPIEFVVRNIITGSIAKKLNLKEGIKLKKPLLEYYYKKDSLDDPMISRDHVEAFNWASQKEIDKINKLSLKINSSLSKLFKKRGLKLVDFKLEFGRLKSNKSKVVLADEISPDSCRLWDVKTNKKLDKDVFRKGIGSLLSAYQEVASRLGIGH